MPNIDEKVVQLTMQVLNLGTPPSLKAHLVRDLGADSLDIVDLMMALEREFVMSISDDEVAAIATLGDAIALVVAKQPILITTGNTSR